MLLAGVVLNVAFKSWTFQISLPGRGWMIIMIIILIGSVCSFALYLQGLKDVGPVETSLLAITEMLSAPLFSALLLGTQFTSTDYLGFAAIIATVILLATEPSV